MKTSTDKSKLIELSRSARKLLGRDLISFLDSYMSGEGLKARETSNLSDQRSSKRFSTQGTSGTQGDQNKVSSVYEGEVRRGKVLPVVTAGDEGGRYLLSSQKMSVQNSKLQMLSACYSPLIKYLKMEIKVPKILPTDEAD